MDNRHSIYCILPPHILEQIAENGSAGQQEKARQTIVMTEQMRGVRRAMDSMGAMSMGAMSMRAAVIGTKQRTIYDAQTGSTLPGIAVRREGEPPVADVAVNEAYDGSGATYDLYADIFNRNSIDGKGMKLDATVHYQKSYDNAFWNGQQMVYGDGDEDLPEAQRLFNRFTISIDVIGHELTHGVTQNEANLAYWDQSGAFNESLSDVFGSLVKQYHLKQSAKDADWLIGQGLLSPNVKGVALRSMQAPGTAYDDPVLGKDPQPAHMKDYNSTTQDNGGVHINSGIPNHAFYVIAMDIGGFAWNKAGMIWYKTLTDKLTERATFQDAANMTYQTAAELFGDGSLEQIAVKNGWAEVGLTVNDVVPVPLPSTPTSTPTPTQGNGCLPQILQRLGLAR
jgi:Zn-dependent metalloprotease